MFVTRFALVVSLLFSFTVVALEGPGMCPHGGGTHQTMSSTDKGLGVDPNG
jgi:hypothetical protein